MPLAVFSALEIRLLCLSLLLHHEHLASIHGRGRQQTADSSVAPAEAAAADCPAPTATVGMLSARAVKHRVISDEDVRCFATRDTIRHGVGSETTLMVHEIAQRPQDDQPQSLAWP